MPFPAYVASLALHFLTTPCAVAQDPLAKIQVGQVHASSLTAEDPVLAGRGPSRRFVLDADTGTVTIALSSLDFDAYLRVESPDGAVLAEADKGGLETDARVELSLASPTRAIVVVTCAKEPGRGEFELSVVAGVLPPVIPAESRDAAIEFQRKARERARDRKDSREELRHLFQLGWRLIESSRQEEGCAVFEEVIALAAARGDGRMEGRGHGALGNVATNTGRFEEALLRARNWVEIADRSGEKTELVRALGDLADSLIVTGDPDAGRESGDRALALARTLEDKDSLAVALATRGRIAWRLGELARARDSILEAQALFREIGDRAKEGSCLAWLGSVCNSLDQKQEALEYFRGQHEITRELGDKPGQAGALINIGSVEDDLGEAAAARTHLETGLALAREVHQRQWEINALNILGGLTSKGGDLEAARRYFQESLALAREAHDVQGECVVSTNLAGISHTLGRMSEALEQYERTLEIARATQQHMLQRGSCMQIGRIRIQLNQYAEAQPMLEEALKLARLLGERDMEAMILGDLGGLANQTGDYETALHLLEQALEIARELGDNVLEASCLALQSVSYRWIDDLDLALDRVQQALALVEGLDQKQLEASLLGTLGEVLHRRGDYAGARAAMERDVALCRETNDRFGEALALTNLAQTHVKSGASDEGRVAAEQAIALSRELGAFESELFSRAALARIALARGDAPLAAEQVREAARLCAQPLSSATEPGRSAGLRARYAEWEQLSQDTIALRLSNAPEDARARIVEEGFQDAGHWKGRALLEGIVEHRAGGRTAEIIAARKERVDAMARAQAKNAAHSQALRAGRPADEVDAIAAEANRLEAHAAELTREIARLSPRDRNLEAPPVVRSEEIRAAVVDERTTFVEYVQGAERARAYVIAHGRPIALVELGELAAIDPVLEAFMRQTGDAASLGSLAEVARGGRELYDLLLAPVLRMSGPKTERLVIVPTSALSKLPFDALVQPRGEPPSSFADVAFVVDRYEITYVPSSTVMVELAAVTERSGEPHLLVLADPLYPGETLESGVESARAPDSLRRTFQRLLETRTEALEVAALAVGRDEPELSKLRDARSGSFRSERVDLHLGAEASAHRLAGDLTRYSILHIAAHGFVDAARPHSSGIALAPDAEGDPGYVTIEQVLDLDLDADLVVLSACETARGGIQRGEGVESLARAFLFAGSRGLIASVWPVDDRSAQETMRCFYERLLTEGVTPARALRAAKLALRRASGSGASRGISVFSQTTGAAAPAGHPFYWAPFVHIGLPR